MPRTIPIQTSFAGGEISPKLRGRVDTELWKKGLDYCENFEPFAEGSLLSKGGTRRAADFDDLTSACRLIEFPRQGDIGFSLVIGAGALSVRDGNTGAQVEATAIDWLKNPRFTYGWQYWDTAPEGTANPRQVINGRYCLGAASPSPGPAWISQAATLGAGDYVLRVNGSHAPGNGVRYMVGTTGDGSTDLFDAAVNWSTGLSDYVYTDIPFTLAAPATVSVRITCSNLANETLSGYLIGAEVKEIAIRSVTTGSALWDDTTTPAMPWTDDQIDSLQVVAEPANNRVLFFHGEVAPYELAFDADSGAWTFAEITFTFTDDLNPDWETPNYPSVAELFQGRLIVSGIKGKMNTLLASKSGSLFDFTLGANAGDAFSLDISTKGAIRWMQGHRTLLIGTDRGEMALVAQGGVLTPSDFEVRPQSGYGSADMQAITAGDAALYVSRDRRRIRMLTYNLQENGWQSRDLTFASEHMTGGVIRDIDWLSTGNDQILAVMRSGEVVAWTFNRSEQVIAPWRASFGANTEDDFGRVYALCVLEAGDQDKVWMLVQRAGTVCLEEWLVADDPERCLLDSYAASNPGAGTAGGYTWLAGETVVAIVDGVAQAPQVVSAAGVITVPVNATTCVAGIFSPRMVTTLPKEGGQPGGTAQGARQRTVKVTIRLNDSALPLVNNVRCAPERSPETSMGEVEPRITADVTARVLGWDDKGAVVLTQDIPLRTEILAIFGTLATNEV